MNGVGAYEMLIFCIKSFVLGIVLWVIYHLLKEIVRIFGGTLFNITRLARIVEKPNLKDMISYAISAAKLRTVNYEVYNVIYVLLTSLIYSAYSYIFLDGAFRVLPLCVLGAAVALLNFLVPNVLVSKLADLSHFISVLLVLPLIVIVWIIRLISRIMTKLPFFCRKKPINSPVSSKNGK